MSIANKFERTARGADRRFGKGVPCAIINNSTKEGTVILRLMKTYGLGPVEILSSIVPETGLDPIHYKLFAIPLQSMKEIADEIRRLGGKTTNPQANRDKQDPIEEQIKEITRDGPACRMIRQTVVLVAVSPLDVVGNTIGKMCRNYDIEIDTADVPQSTLGRFIPKTAEYTKDGKLDE